MGFQETRIDLQKYASGNAELPSVAYGKLKENQLKPVEITQTHDSQLPKEVAISLNSKENSPLIFRTSCRTEETNFSEVEFISNICDEFWINELVESVTQHLALNSYWKVREVDAIESRLHSTSIKPDFLSALQAVEKLEGNIVDTEVMNSQVWQTSYEMAEIDVAEWIKNMQERKVAVKHLAMSIFVDHMPFTINLVRVGKIVEDEKFQWRTTLRILQAILDIKRKFDIKLPSDSITIFEVLDLEMDSRKLYGDPSQQGLQGCMVDTLGTPAWYDEERKAIMLLALPARLLGQDSQKVVTEVDSDFALRLVRHELAHYMDRNMTSKTSTREQTEGFARMCDLNFDFEQSIANLREKPVYYGRRITPSQLERIFSNNPDRGKTPKAEAYNLTASFYCFVVEQLGPTVFKNFYGLLAGRLSAHDFSGDFPILTEPRKARGNLTQALNIACRGTKDFDPEQFINQYLEKINESLAKNPIVQ